MDNIEFLIRDLDWNKSEYVTNNAIQELLKVSEEEAILLAKQSNNLCCKSCWHNAALVLKEIEYPRNRLALPYLIDWFQDINWPGIQTIIELLKEIDVEILIPYIKEATNKALNDNDELWAFGILYLLDELNIEKSNLEEYDLLKRLVKSSETE
ncbi:MAG: DUF5071 domain-containing protein [Clostridiaceae bacterium]